MNRFVRAALLGSAVTVSLAAQQLSLGTISASPGQTVTLSVSLASQGAQISDVGFDVLYNSANLSVDAAAGPSATAAGKGLSANPVTAGDLRIIISGLNQTLIPDGSVAVLTIQIPANAAPATYPITFAKANASTPGATLITPGASSGSVTVIGPPGPLAIPDPNLLPAATLSAAYSQAVTATGGSPPYTWSATGLPSGLTIASGGVISGTPTTAAGGSFNVQVTVTDSSSATTNKSYSLTVNPALVISGPASLPSGLLGITYPSTTITATGGSGVYAWSATGLPAGLTMNTVTGVITGTPSTTTGSPFNVQVTVTDSNSVRTIRGYSLTVSAPLSISGPALLSVGTVNVAYPSTTVTATGGSGVYTWSAAGLPAGLTINPAIGVITGTPSTITGSPFTVQVTVTDSNSATAKTNYTLIVSAQSNQIPLTISAPATLPVLILNTAYAVTIFAQGGSGIYSWSATGLPNGLSIGANTGTITGTPTTIGGSPYTVQVTVADSTGAKASRGYKLSFNSLSISGPASLPLGPVNLAYPNTTVTATGGSGTYTWSATGLPPGLSIGPTTGTISGAPSTRVGSPFSVQVTVTDSNSSTASMSYSLTVSAASVTLPVIVSVTNAAAGQSAAGPNMWVSVYGSNFASAGFTDNWSNSIVNGKLPTVLDGVSVAAGGQPAYVSYLSATQINVVMPNLGVGSLQVTVTTPAGTSAPVPVSSQTYSPAFFLWPDNQPVATHVDYTPAVTNGTFAGMNTIPAKPGEAIILWGTGFGATNPAAPFGVAVPVSPTYYTAGPVTVTIDNIPASVYGTALAPGFAGLYQLVVTVPASLPNGNHTVIASIDGAQTPATTLTVQN